MTPNVLKKHLVTGSHLLRHPIFRSMVKAAIDKLRSRIMLKRAHPWHSFAKEIQFANKVAGPILKRQHTASLSVTETELIRLNVLILSGNASGPNHHAWLKAQGVVVCA